jgi:predicted NBD/HSP70 family sugar kinase
MGSVAAPQQSRGAAAAGLRRHNLSIVLELLHRDGPASRSRLTSLTGLNRSTVGALVGELTELGLVHENPAPVVAGPGRPSPVVEVRPAGAVALALELTVDSIAAAVVGLGGEVLMSRREARPRDASTPTDAVAAVAEFARQAVAAVGSSATIVGAAAAVAGITNTRSGVVHLGPNLGWRDAPVGDLFSKALDLGKPVDIVNEADLGAIGELRRGIGRGHEHLVYVSGEVGIGCGVICAGELLRGAAGYAAEAGHTMINPAGVACRCGAIGCWESEAGEAALLRRARLSAGRHGLGALEELAVHAENGDPTTLAALDETGRWLGLGVANLINLFNPEIIVLGGLYQRLYDHLEPSLLQAARTSALDVNHVLVTVRRSELGEDAPLMGAAEHVFERLIANPAGGQP